MLFIFSPQHLSSQTLFTVKDDGKNVRTYEKTIKNEYENDAISIYYLYPDPGGQASNFTIEKGSYIRFAYSW